MSQGFNHLLENKNQNYLEIGTTSLLVPTKRAKENEE